MKTVQLDMSNQITIIKLHVVFVQQGSILHLLAPRLVPLVEVDNIRMKLEKAVVMDVQVESLVVQAEVLAVLIVQKESIKIQIHKQVVRIAQMDSTKTSQIHQVVRIALRGEGELDPTMEEHHLTLVAEFVRQVIIPT